MNVTEYTYDVRLTSGSDILRSPSFSEAAPNVGEMMIYSNAFNDYESCIGTLDGLMSKLSQLQSSFSGKNHVIVSKMNPLLEPENTTRTDAKEWDTHTVMRCYVAEAEALKKNAQLVYSIAGQIRVNQQILGLQPPEATH